VPEKDSLSTLIITRTLGEIRLPERPNFMIAIKRVMTTIKLKMKGLPSLQVPCKAREEGRGPAESLRPGGSLIRVRTLLMEGGTSPVNRVDELREVSKGKNFISKDMEGKEYSLDRAGQKRGSAGKLRDRNSYQRAGKCGGEQLRDL